MSVTQNNLITDIRYKCPLCFQSGLFDPLVSPLGSSYRLCEKCKLIFIEKRFLPDPIAEKERYMTHQNGLESPGYVNFLYRAINPSLKYIERSMIGLDYGCGPNPTLSLLLDSEGLVCQNYDPFFYPKLPQGQFDFIFTTEAAEHFFQPAKEFKTIHSLLTTGGLLTIMTEFWKDLDQFSNWYYAKDFTHVSFYNPETIHAICDLFGFKPLNLDNSRVSVLRKL